MKIVDARRLNCPQPLILTKNAMEEGMDEIIVLVDNDSSKQNVLKYCSKMGFTAEVNDKNEDIEIMIKRGNAKENMALADEIIKEVCDEDNKYSGTMGYMIGTNMLGSGSEELGKLLMKGFIYTLTQAKPCPDFIVFLNSGVKLACEGSDSLDDLKHLLQGGTRIVSCGTCLDYYKLGESLKIGEVSNMYDIVETITEAKKVITLG